jgi:hypothetical protein
MSEPEETEWTTIPGPEGLHLEVQLAGEPPTIIGIRLTGGPIRRADLSAIPVSKIETEAAQRSMGPDPRQLPPLVRPAEITPDQFSRSVAEYYMIWGNKTHRPAAAMAAAYGVKLGTMHSWIREARLRGYLPQARRGKR